MERPDVPWGASVRVPGAESLAQSPESYRLMFEKAPLGVFHFDEHGIIRACNDRFVDIIGSSREALIGFDMLRRITNEGVRHAVREALEGRQGHYEGPYRSVTGDKETFLRMLTSRVDGPDGRFLGGIALVEDITERLRTEAALERSEANYRHLVEHAVDGILIGDTDGNLVEVNSRACELTGFTRQELQGMNIRTLFTEESIRRTPLRYDLLQQGLAVLSERDLRRKDGTILPIEMNTKALPDGRYQAFIRDITERRRAEEALRQAQKLESLGVLAGGIAHDFNNLLTAILGNLDLARMSMDAASPALPFLQAVERTALKASELTHQMLVYSGKGPFKVKSLNLNEIVQDLIRLMEASLSKKIEIRFRPASGLPLIEADPAQIQQVILNLVTNAADAIGEGAGTLSLITSERTLDGCEAEEFIPSKRLLPGHYVQLTVRDTGCGMSREVIDRIFDPFFSTKAAGRGLGMSALLGILRGHGGGLRIDSEVGRGTTFEVVFPVPSRAPRGGRQSSAGSRVPLRGTVLLVEDEEGIRDATGAVLESLGLTVLRAADGQEGIDLLSGNPEAVDVVLMDLTMPRMDGREAFEAMRRVRPDLPVILTSGYGEQESLGPFLGRGLAGFLQKPYMVDDLRAVLGPVLPGKASPDMSR